MQYINHALNKIITIPKKVLIELCTAVLGNAISKASIVSELILVDKTYIENLVDFIGHLKENGLIKECDERIVGECIFDIVFMELFIYLNIQERTTEDVTNKTQEKIAIILKGYRTNQ
jgi:hypothetical protein